MKINTEFWLCITEIDHDLFIVHETCDTYSLWPARIFKNHDEAHNQAQYLLDKSHGFGEPYRGLMVKPIAKSLSLPTAQEAKPAIPKKTFWRK